MGRKSADKKIKLEGYMTHIREVLLELDKNSMWEYTCAYNDFESPADIFNIKPEDYNELLFYDPNEPDKGNQVLKKAKGGIKTLNLFRAIKRFIIYLVNNGKDINRIDWTTITHEEYMTFVCSPHNSDSPGAALMPPSTTPTNTSRYTGTGQHIPLKDAELFKKSVCRDSTLFPELKNDGHHTTWTDNMMITTKSQRVHKVLDADYVPTMANEELFHLHCDFMLSVFTMVFKTDKSKSILKEHVTLDKPTAAQDIWRDLQEYFKGSTTGRDQIEQYHNYCSTTQINDGKWKGNTHSYILHFQQQV